MHLAAQRRSEQNAVERNRARDEEQERRRSAEVICSALAAHGLAAAVYLDWSTRTFTGDVVLTAQSARDLLARLDQTVIHAEPRT